MDKEKFYKMLKDNKLDFISRHSIYGILPALRPEDNVKELKLDAESIKYLVSVSVDEFRNKGTTIEDFDEMIQEILQNS